MAKKTRTSYKKLKEEYKRLAWRLDKQMYRLEKASARSEYENITKFAYAKMLQEIQAWSPGNKRWGQSLPGGKDQREKTRNLQKKINIMKQLEKLPSFSLKRLKQIYSKSAKTINKKYGTNLTWQNITNFYESDAARVMDSMYGSSTVIMALGKVKRSSGKTMKRWEEEMKKNPNYKIDKDINVDKAVKTLLEKYKK